MTRRYHRRVLPPWESLWVYRPPDMSQYATKSDHSRAGSGLPPNYMVPWADANLHPNGTSWPRSVQTFLQGSQPWATDRHSDHAHATPSVAIGRTYAVHAMRPKMRWREALRSGPQCKSFQSSQTTVVPCARKAFVFAKYESVFFYSLNDDFNVFIFYL